MGQVFLNHEACEKHEDIFLKEKIRLPDLREEFSS
jgi:hypothetical protein